MEAIAKLLDPYSIRARLFPAIICLLPLLGLFALFHWAIPDGIEKTLVFVVVSSALAFFTTGVVRQRGKAYEPVFLERTGGWQTTIMLRRRDDSIDGATKERYYAALSDLTGMTLPSAEDELANPDGADNIYRSATKALLEARRDEKFGLVHAENASYGFWRNLMGIRYIALTLAAVILTIAVFMFVIGDGDFSSVSSFRQHIPDNASSLLYCAACELAYIIVLFALVNERIVVANARNYSYALLRTLDAPEPVPGG